MTVFILQIIAMFTMLCDHVGSSFFNNQIVMRSVGRFAFPIYAFLLAEGYRHIKDDPEKTGRHLSELTVPAPAQKYVTT